MDDHRKKVRLCDPYCWCCNARQDKGALKKITTRAARSALKRETRKQINDVQREEDDA